MPRLLRHLLSAFLKVVLFVLMPLVLNTGPLPVVFGAGRLTPFLRMHAENLASALLEFAPPKPAAPPAGMFPAPHFFSAACSCEALSPLGSLNPPLGGWPVLLVGGAELGDWGLGPVGEEGSVTPCFCRHSRSAVDLLEVAPDVLLDELADLLLAELVLPLLAEELPHAASVRQAPSTDRAMKGRTRWRLVG